MTIRDDQATAKVLDDHGTTASDYFAAAAQVDRGRSEPREAGEKPTHYKVICISMYTDDLNRLDSMVDTLKARGLTKANRSALIRYALGAVDLESVPKGL
jgi:hypothetical protein